MRARPRWLDPWHSRFAACRGPTLSHPNGGREERSIKSVSDSQSPLETPDPAIGETPSPVLQLGQDDEGTFEVDANVLATGRTCIIGASGSGKSYAVGVICEELCKSRVPFAIIDTEGEHSGLKEKYDAVCIGDEPSCDLQWSGLDSEHLGAQAPDLAPADPGPLRERRTEAEGLGPAFQHLQGGREEEDAIPDHRRGGGQVRTAERREGGDLQRDRKEREEARGRAHGLHPASLDGRQEHTQPVRKPAHREARDPERPAGGHPVLPGARDPEAAHGPPCPGSSTRWAGFRRCPGS